MADPFTPRFVDLVKNMTTTTGTGDFVLGSAASGHAGFQSALQVGDRFYYSCLGVDKPGEREVGRGTLLSGGKIAREPVNGNKTNFTSGNKTIALIAAAEWFGGIAGDIAALETDVGTLELQVAGLDTELDATSQDLAELAATVAGMGNGGGSGGAAPIVAATRTELAQAASANGVMILREAGRTGLFRFDPANRSADVAADPAQGLCVAPSAAPSGASGAWVRAAAGELRPEWFGAKGDGVTNDSAAFAALSAMIAFLDGGTIALRPDAVYVVGAQALTNSAFQPVYPFILDIDGCTKPVVVEGNGATMLCAPALKYGAFNTDGTPMATANGYMGVGGSTPFYAMVRITGCSGGVEVANLVLDGNSDAIALGGKWGDNDWQLGGTGLQIGHWLGTQNSCAVTVSNVRAINQCSDGIAITRPGTTSTDPLHPVTLTNCDCDRNARLGMSWVGGKGVTAIGCKFNNTGTGPFASAPKAGLDIEPESAVCEFGNFVGCEFVNNAASGVQGYGAPSHIHFEGCRFVGTTGPSLTGFGPYWSLDDCMITGQMVNAFASATGGPEATQFNRCKLLFGTARSPTGLVYAPSGHMCDFGGQGAQNIHMKQCLLDSEGNNAVTLSYLSGISFTDCEMVQDGSGAGTAQGATYYGVNKVTSGGSFDGYGRVVRGEFSVNGVANPRFWGTLNSFTHGLVAIGSDGSGGYVDGKYLAVFGPSGRRVTVSNYAGEGYLDHVADDGSSWGILNIRASNVRLISQSGTTNVSGALVATGAISGANLSGTNSGDQTITLTGDVSGSGTGSFAATIANDTVTYAKMQNVSATDRLLGRASAGAGDVEEIVCTAAGRALLDDVDATTMRATLGLAAVAASGSAADLTTGTLARPVATSGDLTTSAGKFGYSAGAGGTVTQATSKATGVTLNKPCGEITMNAAALAANTAVTFTLTNSAIEVGDRIVVNHKSGGTFGAYVCDARAAAGSATMMLRNVSAASLSEAVVLGFAVVKAVTA